MLFRHELITTLRGSLVALTIIAVLVCGSFTTGRSIAVGATAEAPSPTIATPADQPVMVEVALEDEPDGEMATGSSGQTATTDYYLTGVVVKTGSDDSRAKRADLQAPLRAVRTCIPASADRPLATAAVVATDLGRQFTLVGAKPSGTS